MSKLSNQIATIATGAAAGVEHPSARQDAPGKRGQTAVGTETGGGRGKIGRGADVGRNGEDLKRWFEHGDNRDLGLPRQRC